jgi:uncharacterized protein YfaS (alpha-2-macroglobulin family)
MEGEMSMTPINVHKSISSLHPSRRSRGLSIISILLLLSLACAIPGLGSPTPSPEASAITTEIITTAQPTPIGVEVVLPPALVETDPPIGAQMPLNGQLKLFFNQPMDHPSVEAAFSGNPSLSGSYNWLDDATLVYTPNEPLLPETDLTINIAATAQSSQGMGLLEPISIAYTTSSYLRLTQRLPEDATQDAAPTSAVVAAFNRPVVALGADPASLPSAFTIQPSTAGSGEWINTSTYIFYPDPALAGGTTYNVTVNTSLTATDGTPLESTSNWSFVTAQPRVVSVEPADAAASVFLDATVQVVFNQVMDPASVEANFSLLDPAGQAVDGEFSWDISVSTLVFTPTVLLERGASYTMLLGADTAALGGATLGNETRLTWQTVPELQIYGSLPNQNSTIHTWEQVTLYMTSPVSQDTVLDYISIDPPVSDLRTYIENGLSVSIYCTFDPDTSYTLTVSPELTDLWGSRLGLAYTLLFQTTGLDPVITFPYSPDLTFLTTNDTGLLALVTNIQSVSLSGGTIPIDDFLMMMGQNGYDIRQSYVPADNTSWTFQTGVPSNQATNVTLPFRPNGLPAQPGLYFLRLNVPQGYGYDGTIVLPVSHYQTTFKLSPTEVLVWAVDLRTNAVAAGLPVAVYNEYGILRASGVTDTDGIFRGDIPARSDPYATFIAILGQPGQDNFGLASSYWSDGISPWDFNLSTDFSGPSVRAYLYTDRPIYRPGDTVYFRGIIRQGFNGRYSMPDLSSYTLMVSDAIGQQLTSFDLPLSGFGTIHGQFLIPETAQPGDFMIGDAAGSSFVSFLVTEYRKPEINLQVLPQSSEILSGDAIGATVNARYFFDAPAGNQNVHWALYETSAYFSLPGGYQVGPVNTNWLNVFNYPYMEYGFGSLVAEGDAQTNAEGLATLEIPTEVQPGRQHYTLEVTLTDASGLPVSTRTDVYTNPADYYIGILPDAWSGAAGAESGFSVLTVDWQGNPSPARSLTAIFQRVEYQRIDPPADQPYEFPTYEPVYTQIASTDFVTGADGTARLGFTPPAPGTYQLDVQGDNTLTQVTLWVAGEGHAVWPNLPNQRLRLTTDQESYLPGDTAQVFIPNPFDSSATALLTVERGEIMRTQVITLDPGGRNVALALTAEDAPNVYVAVTLVGQSNGSPDFRQGYVELTVAVVQEHLNVVVTSQPERSGPGEPITLTIRVSDSTGTPVEGEFSVAVVDLAVLALAQPNAPDILSAFYGPQPLGVRTGLSLAAWGQRMRFMPGGMGGGGGEGVSPVVRERFPDTAFWEAQIVTDAQGEATLSVPLPDSLTTWQVLVRGLNAETWVGEAQINIVTTQELLVRPVTPRFLVAGDHAELAAIVQNNTSIELQGEVNLQATGFLLDEDGTRVQAVTVPAGGQVRVSWWGTAQDVASADLVFSVQAGSYSDAVRVASGELPVLRYTAPQTFATSGVLVEAGERLELVSLPVTFDPTSGDLTLELAPSLAAAMLDGLDTLEHYPYECTEQTLSRFLPNLEAYRAVQELGLDAPDLQARLERTLNDGVGRLVSQQNSDGSWGWWAGNSGNDYLTAYVLFGLSRVHQAGISVPPDVIQRAIDYLNAAMPSPSQVTDAWVLDRLAFEYFALAQAGVLTPAGPQTLFTRRDQLSPWAQALLASALESTSPGSAPVSTLLSDLQANASRSATGVHWENAQPGWQNMTSTLTNSAMVIYVLSQQQPASTLLPDAVNYLMAHRQADGAWGSTYESAWVMMAMTEVMRGTGELSGNFTFSATLNGVQIADGQAGGDTQLNPVATSLPVGNLYPDAPNALTISREAGSGRLYYTAALQVYRPVEDIQPLGRGMTLSRQYYPADAEIRTAQPISSAQAGNAVTVRLTLVLPTDVYNLVVEDYIPAGTEILNTRLQTSQLGEYGQLPPLYDPASPYRDGWGWWLFGPAQVYDDHIAFTTDYLTAGTYELTYTLVILQPGEYHVLPARAWMFYFPEVQGTSAGTIFEIRP